MGAEVHAKVGERWNPINIGVDGTYGIVRTHAVYDKDVGQRLAKVPTREGMLEVQLTREMFR